MNETDIKITKRNEEHGIKVQPLLYTNKGKTITWSHVFSPRLREFVSFSAECRVRSDCTCWRSDFGLCSAQVNVSEEQPYHSIGYF